MAIRPEDQPWYSQWHEALERVIAAQMARDATKPGTPEREIAERECDAAYAAFRVVANMFNLELEGAAEAAAGRRIPFTLASVL